MMTIPFIASLRVVFAIQLVSVLGILYNNTSNKKEEGKGHPQIRDLAMNENDRILTPLTPIQDLI
jgi:hypothetical protein